MSESYSKSFIKDNIIVFIGHLIVYAKAIIIMPLIIKNVGVNIYGGFSLLSSLLGFIFGISSFGAGFKAKRFLPSTPDRLARQQLFYPQFYFQLISLIFLSIFLVYFNNQIQFYFFKDINYFSPQIIPFYLISYFLFSQGSDYYRYTSRIKNMTLATTLYPYLQILFIIFICVFDIISINLLIYSFIFASILISFPCFFYIIKELKLKFIFFKYSELIDDIKIGLPIVLNYIVDFILAGSDRYIISYYMGVTAVGYYTSGYTLGSIAIFIPKAMGCVIPQILSKAFDRGHLKHAQKLLAYAVKYFIIISIPFIFGIFILSKDLLNLLGNADTAQNAWLVSPIIALSMFFYGLNILFTNILYVHLDTKSIFKSSIIASLFNFFANIIILFIFKNILIAATTTLISYLISFLYIFKISSKYWKISIPSTTIIKSSISSFLMTFIINFIYLKNDAINISAKIVSGIIIYSLFLFTLKIITKEEILSFKRQIISE